VSIESPLGWMPQTTRTSTGKEWEAELLQVEELFMKLHTRLPTEMQAIRSLTASALWRSPDHWDMASDPT
jgi:phosphoenolpyruvate carboxykinase (GTP)